MHHKKGMLDVINAVNGEIRNPVRLLAKQLLAKQLLAKQAKQAKQTKFAKNIKSYLKTQLL
jgi:hypothetical protein